MKQKHYLIFGIIIVLFIFGIIFIGTYVEQKGEKFIPPIISRVKLEKPRTTVITKTKSFAPGIPIKIESILPERIQPIKLNDEIDIIFRVSVEPSYGVIENVTATVTISEGLILVGGTQNWNGDLKPDEPISFNTKIKIIKTGDWMVEAVANEPITEHGVYLDRDKICISVTDSETIIAHGDCVSIPECKDTVLPDGTIIRCEFIE